ncbi:amidohydrolase family protein [Candidatus Microgenomates bacterium]|nr:amidohydrolase family protein [Candidatus Microgenomates bacterium]
MSKIISLPGLIDVHTHLREPGATQKEDFETGTKAAIAGGYTAILDMPNNPEPTITPEAVDKKISLANGRIYCDVGFNFGGTLESSKYFDQIKTKVMALKVYMNHTTGTLLQEDPHALQTIFERWPKQRVLIVHAEKDKLALAIKLAKRNGNRLHVAHVALAEDINRIRKAKTEGLPITCEVTCHHLFLTNADTKRLGPFGQMKPDLGMKQDQNALWKAISDGTMDIIAQDHAPHTIAEKKSEKPPHGVPGLETALPLLLTAVKEDRLTIEKLIELTNTNPRKIFNIPQQEDTFVEIDMEEKYRIDSNNLYTKCGWTPFEGVEVKGKIKKVALRGKVVFENGKISGLFGKIMFPAN